MKQYRETKVVKVSWTGHQIPNPRMMQSRAIQQSSLQSCAGSTDESVTDQNFQESNTGGANPARRDRHQSQSTETTRDREDKPTRARGTKGMARRTLVLVSTRTSRDWTRVERAPATHSPAKGLKKWRPGSARRRKRPHFSTTATLAWSTHPQKRKKAFTISLGPRAAWQGAGDPSSSISRRRRRRRRRRHRSCACPRVPLSARGFKTRPCVWAGGRVEGFIVSFHGSVKSPN